MINFAKAKYSQVFLINAHIIKLIIQTIKHFVAVHPDTKLIEMGIGHANLTKYFVTNPNYIGFEIDKHLYNNIHTFAPTANIFNEDFFSETAQDKLKIFLSSTKNKVFFSNVPYNITGVCLKYIFLNSLNISMFIVMLQKEVADKIIAPVNAKNYSSLSVIFQTLCTTKMLCSVSKNSFLPKPAVDSTVLIIEPNHELPDTFNKIQFVQFANALFKNRRKTLKNNLFAWNSKLTKLKMTSILNEQKLTDNIRAQALTTIQIQKLFHFLSKLEPDS